MSDLVGNPEDRFSHNRAKKFNAKVFCGDIFFVMVPCKNHLSM